MATRFYPVAVVKDPKAGYYVQSIDLEPAFSSGRTIEEALDMAQDALNIVIETLSEDGKDIPEPTPMENVKPPKFPKEYGTLIGVFPVQATLPGKNIRISVNMDEELVKRIDAVAGNYGRSEWLEGAARMRLSPSAGLEERPAPPLRGYWKQAAGDARSVASGPKPDKARRPGRGRAKR
jgi:predicted RNase H-like HicB family nuclease